ncbi:TVP38/TMEM64 family protein [Methylomonas sp. MgM2]
MPIRKITLIIIGAVLLVALAHEFELHLGALEQDLQKLGAWAPAGYIGVFVLLTPLGLSVDALCFVAGILFPLLPAQLYMAVATYSAAALIFIQGRYLFRSKVSALLQREQRLAGISAALSENAFKLMFLLRLTPLPFALLSYAFAVSQVRFLSYLAATSGILLYNCTLVYLGFTTKHLAGLVSGKAGPPPVPYPLLAAGLVLAIVVILYIGKTVNGVIKDMNSKVSIPKQ